MTKHDCDICRGEGIIRLPVRKQMGVTELVSDVPSLVMEEAVRRFPCPQCSEQIALTQLHAERETMHFRVPEDFRHIAIDSAKRDLVHLLADGLLKRGFFQFEEISPSRDVMHTVDVRATVAVVKPDRLEGLERAIAQRQDELAKEVVSEARYQINNWGSYYRATTISKQSACLMIEEALGTVLRRREREAKKV